jgi:hypothetical protein
MKELPKLLASLVVVLVAMLIWDGFLKATIFPES